MKLFSIRNMALCSSLLLSGGVTTLSAQTTFQSQTMDMKLTGTSNLHDWEMKATSGTSKASIFLDASGKIISIQRLSFSFPARNLKSAHDAMDKNTYKALNTDRNPNISFSLTSSKVIAKGNNNYQLNCIGNMSIAGKTKAVTLVAFANYNPATRMLSVVGIQKMKMTDYNVTPPTAVMGTIKTGDDISISYNVKFNR
jgi:hypothetical protein